MVDDRVQPVFVVQARRPARDGQRAIVTLAVEARNQHDAIIQSGTTTLMMLP